MWGGWNALLVALIVAITQMPVAHAQRAPARYRPSVGQTGKDAVWVPVPQALLGRALAAAKVQPHDTVMDLGSGDGRVVIEAARTFGVRAVGIEYDAQLLQLSRHNAQRAGVADRIKFIEADLFEVDLNGADLITMYLMPHLNARLRPRLLALKPGTRIVSFAFGMGDWRPDARLMAEGRGAYLWIVPASVAGRWRIAQDGADDIHLTLTQHHQFIAGRAQCGSETVKLSQPQLSGARVRFAVATRAGGKRVYTGEVAGDRMEGTVHIPGAAHARWTALRLAEPTVV